VRVQIVVMTAWSAYERGSRKKSAYFIDACLEGFL